MKNLRMLITLTLAVAVLLLASCAPASGALPANTAVPVLQYSRSLEALTMRNGITGNFFLASGPISDSLKYVFVEEGSDGFTAVKTALNTEAVYLEDIGEGETPYVEYFKCMDGGYLAYCSGVEGVPEVLGNYAIYGYWVFHIPKSSVASTYDLGFTPTTDE